VRENAKGFLSCEGKRTTLIHFWGKRSQESTINTGGNMVYDGEKKKKKKKGGERGKSNGAGNIVRRGGKENQF